MRSSKPLVGANGCSPLHDIKKSTIMSFAKAFQKVLKEQGQNIEVPEMIETDPQLVPHMYRAQVQPRCSLQFARDQYDRNIWIEQWVNPRKEDGKTYLPTCRSRRYLRRRLLLPHSDPISI